MKRLVTAIVLSTLLLAGCAGQVDPMSTSQSVTPSTTDRSGPRAPADAVALLDEFGLEGKDTVEIIDRLDRLGGDDRPAGLMASVRPGELLLSAGAEEVSLAMPQDRFYLSVAPYVDQTHECFHHSLTTCTGELASTDVQVLVVDETDDRVLLDQTRTTFANGFTGFWLPRDIEGTLRVTYGRKTGEVEFTTDVDAPTCLTTLRLV